MSIGSVVEQLEAEIARLKGAVAILEGGRTGRAVRGRTVSRAGVRRKRVVSAATRALIAEKMRQAWKRGRKKHK
jgi:hypothetical protein